MKSEDMRGYVQKTLNKAWEINQGLVRQVARSIVDAYRSHHHIYAFGSGHSHVLIEEMYYRAGGLTIVTPIWDPALMLHEDAKRSSQLEQTPGYAQKILGRVPFTHGDVLWVISNSGRNPLIVELASAARDQGVFVVALMSLAHARAVTSRSPSNKKLYEVAHLVLDNAGVLGDAGYEVPGMPQPMFPTSTIVGAVIVNWVWVEVARILTALGEPPEVLTSFNVDKDDTKTGNWTE